MTVSSITQTQVWRIEGWTFARGWFTLVDGLGKTESHELADRWRALVDMPIRARAG